MKTIKRMGAQGDVIFIRCEQLPAGLTPTDDPVVAHSETGHHHVATGDLQRYVSDDVIRSFIVAKGDVEIEHRRPWDTHETLRLLADDNAGETIWEIRRQREYTPEGLRIVQD